MDKKIPLLIVVTILIISVSIAEPDPETVKYIGIRRGAYISSIIGGIPSCAEFRSKMISTVQVCPITQKSLSAVVILLEKIYHTPTDTVPLVNAYEYFVVTGRRMKKRDFSELVIRFRVSKNWLSENNFSNVSLYKWEVDTWKKINTTEIVEHEDYKYFESRIDSYAVLAIAGYKEVAEENVTTTIKTPEENITNTTTTTIEQERKEENVTFTNVSLPQSFIQSSIQWFSLILILIIIGITLSHRKKNYGGELQ